MKRLIAVTLCLIMLFTVSATIADELTLPVKLERQMQHDGNGLKGSFSIRANADAAEHPFLFAVQNAEFSVLRNASGEDWHMIVFQTDEAEQQKNRTELYKTGQTMYLRSDFVPDHVFQVSAEALFATFLEVGTGENPSIMPAILSMLTMSDSGKSAFDPVAVRYGKMLEIWLGDFMTEPELTYGEDGSARMNLTYVVPYEEACREIAILITNAAVDPDVIALTDNLLTEEQKAVFLNPYLGDYYAEALKSLHLTGDIRFVKTVTALGEMISTEISIPLSAEMTGFTTLTITNREHMAAYTLIGEQQTIRLIIPENLNEIAALSDYAFTAYLIRCSTEQGKEDGNLALKIDVERTTEKSFDDETSKEHEIHHYTISATRNTEYLPETAAESLIPSCDPISAKADLHYSGKVGPNAPTTLNVDAAITQGELEVTLTGKVKTAATWPFVPFSTDQPVILSSLKDATATAAEEDWVKNAFIMIQRTESAEPQVQVVEGE